MRKFLLATTALLALTTASSAAIVGDLGVNPTSAQGSFDNAVGGGAFSDQWTFQLSNFSTYLTIASATNVFPNPTDFITGFTGAVFEVVGAVGGADDILVLGPAAGVVGACGFNCQVFGGSAFLPSGEYYLNISGVGGGTSGYGGNLATTPIAAVPEPATWALMLLGFAGMIGVSSMRNKWKGFRWA